MFDNKNPQDMSQEDILFNVAVVTIVEKIIISVKQNTRTFFVALIGLAVLTFIRFNVNIVMSETLWLVITIILSVLTLYYFVFGLLSFISIRRNPDLFVDNIIKSLNKKRRSE